MFAAEGFELDTLIRYGLAIASVAVGVMHLSAASAHTEHAPILAFFVGAGLLQILWATAVVSPKPPALLLRAGALVNAGLIGVWLASRLSGFPFVEGAEHVEPVGVKDTATVAVELLVVVGALILAAGGRSLSLRLRSSERTLAPLAVATALLIVPGLAVPAHQHIHDPSHHHDGKMGTHLAAAHEHGLEEAEAGHSHVTAGTHDHMDGNHAEHVDAHGATGHVHDGSSTHPAAAPRSNAVAPSTPPGIKATVRYGPFVMPPADAGGEAHYNRVLTGIAKPCSDCYIVRARPDLVYADGSSANFDTGAMLHHAVWTRPSIQDVTCGRNSAIGSQGLRFFASGNERTIMRLPDGFGYYVGTDSWNLIAEIMNHSDRPQAVYISLDVLYRPASDNMKKVTPVWMDIDNCGDSQYAIPAGKSNTLWTWRSTITGRVVSTAGHVHNSGIKTVLTNETTKQHMCTSVAGYGRKPAFKGNIESMSDCVWDRIGVIREGDDFGIRAYYDSTQAQYDVMGINIAMVYETNDLRGGTAPPNGSTTPQEQQPTHSGGHDHGGP